MSKRYSWYIGTISALLLGLTTGTIACLTTTLPGITQVGFNTNHLPVNLIGTTNSLDRYILSIPIAQMTSPVSQFIITHPSSYKGTINPLAISVRVNGVRVAPKGASWDQAKGVITIEVATPVPARRSVELILDRVQNPSVGGAFLFKGAVSVPDYILPRSVGSWNIIIR